MAARKNFFAKPLTRSGIRRLKQELGSIGMSKEAIDARISQILKWQSMSPKAKKGAWEAKHIFLQGGSPGQGRRS